MSALVSFSAVALLLASCGIAESGVTTEATPQSTPAPPSPTSTQSTPVASGTTSTFAVPTTTSTADTTTTLIRAPGDLASGSGCTPGTSELPDGRWYGLAVEPTANHIEFDLACWFDGYGAVVASAEDGEESPPPNDYYVRNVNPTLRTVDVAGDVPVLWYGSDVGDPDNEETISYLEWIVLRVAQPFNLAVWITVENRSITAIDEQWVP